jgi:predicted SprT family Zn-dependent metalloprotease
MRDKIQTLHEIRTKWAELAQNVNNRFRVRVGMPKQIYYVENRGFLARVWTLPTSVEKLEINSKCLLPENWDYFVGQIIIHEFVHCWDAAKNGKSSGHGPSWQNLMRLLGATPDRCGSWPSDKRGMRPVCHANQLIDLDDY